MVGVNPFGKTRGPNKSSCKTPSILSLLYEDVSGCLRSSGDGEAKGGSWHSFLMTDRQNLLQGSTVLQAKPQSSGRDELYWLCVRMWRRVRDGWAQGFWVLKQLFTTRIHSCGASEARMHGGLGRGVPGSVSWAGLHGATGGPTASVGTVLPNSLSSKQASDIKLPKLIFIICKERIIAALIS